MTIKKRIYLTLAALSFLTLLMLVFVILPLFSKIKESSKELVLQKENFAGLEAKITNLEKFKTLYPELQHFLEQVESLFVDLKVPIEFIDFLENTSEKRHLKTEILSVSEGKSEKDFWPHLIFQMASLGSFPDFLKFLEKIENGPYLIELQNISINKLAEEEEFGPGKIRATFSIKVFAK